MISLGGSKNHSLLYIGSRKEGYLSRVGKLKPTLLTFPPISLPPSGPQVDPGGPSGDRNNDTSGCKFIKRGGSFYSGGTKQRPLSFNLIPFLRE